VSNNFPQVSLEETPGSLFIGEDQGRPYYNVRYVLI
jgi:hypothetical protein